MTIAALINKQWIYRTQPTTAVGPEHYELVQTEVDANLSTNEVLLGARFISVDPYMRINQSAGETWGQPHPLNTVQSAGVVGQIIASADPAWAVDDWAAAHSGWQTVAKLHSSALTRVNTAIAPPSAYLGVLGMPGRTAWFGLTEAGRPKAGEVVVVSGAAGAVGSLVVQFAKRHGCKVVGIAGGIDKCNFVTKKLGADIAIDYRAHNTQASLQAALKQATGGVDVYFDNVGGMITDAIMPLINLRARIIICGQISQYNGGLDSPEMGPRFLHHMLYQRATIQGILARDYTHRMDEMLRIVAPWVADKTLVYEETFVDGFEQLPTALNSLFTGKNTGKLVVRV